MDFLEHISKKLGIPVIGLVIFIIIFIVTGTWIVFIPLILIVALYYIINTTIENKMCSVLLSYYGTSVIMSICGLLIHYFPNSIGGGLFQSGYIIASFITLSGLFDIIFKVQTDSWGIVYDWVVVSSFVIIVCILLIKDRFK
jgi:hypothetical protein